MEPSTPVAESSPAQADPSPGPAAAPPRRRKPFVAIGVAAVLVAAGIAAVVVFATRSHHHTKGGGQTSALPKGSPVLTGGAGQLIALLQSGQKVTFHAAYRVVGDPASTGGLSSLEIWQAPPRVREDSVRSTGGHTARTESFITAAGTTLCTQTDAQAWACKRVTSTDAVGPTGVADAIKASAAGQPVVTSESSIGGRPVTCFDVGQPADTVRLCATHEGIPVLIANASVRYELASYSTNVDQHAFTPPRTP